MKLIWIFAIVTIVGLEYYMNTAAPITKWFKTDNNTYYIETQQTYTWQQSYNECQKKNLGLISLKAYNEDPLLTEYIKQTFDTIPEFWLKSSDKVDLSNLNQLLASLMSQQLFNINIDDTDNAEVVTSDSSDNCALSANGTGKACEALHGFVCKENNSQGSDGKNVQNIVLKFN